MILVDNTIAANINDFKWKDATEFIKNRYNCAIYCIKSNLKQFENKYYIGQSKHYHRRIADHFIGRCHNNELKLDIADLGAEHFSVIILETIDAHSFSSSEKLKEELDLREKYWINLSILKPY